MTTETPVPPVDPTQSDAFWHLSGIWERCIDSLTIFGHAKFIQFYLDDWLNEMPTKVAETILNKIEAMEKAEIFCVRIRVAWEVFEVSIGDCEVEGDKAILPTFYPEIFYVNKTTGRLTTKISAKAKQILGQ